MMHIVSMSFHLVIFKLTQSVSVMITYTKGSFTIGNHDSYSLGEFKDDQMQRIWGNFSFGANFNASNVSGAFTMSKTQNSNSTNWTSHEMATIAFDSSRVTRTGATTHGKQLGVHYIIKAL